jgi:hypothetical protein
MRGVLLGMLSILWGCAGAQVGPGYVLVPVGAEQVGVSLHRVTTLVFPTAVRAGVRVTRDVQVEKVRGVENVLAIRAARGGFAPTNLAVFGMDGRAYSFTLFYSDTAAAWQYRVTVSGDSSCRGLILTGLPADEFRLGEDARIMERQSGRRLAAVNIEKMRLVVTGVYYADSLTWLVGRIRNQRVTDFSLVRIRLYTQDRKRVKRMAIQEAEIDPVFSDIGAVVISGGGARDFAVSYRGISVPTGKRLLLEMTDRDGLRVIRVRVPLKKLLSAMRRMG